jgi:hypothetical protein
VWGGRGVAFLPFVFVFSLSFLWQILTGSIITGWASLCGVLGRYSSLGYILGIIAGMRASFLRIATLTLDFFQKKIVQGRDYMRSRLGLWVYSPLRESLVSEA